MKTVTRHQADDGTLFESETAALKRDAIVARIKQLNAMLAPSPVASHIRVKQAQLAAYKEGLIDLCREVYPDAPVFQHPASEISPWSYAGRLINESGPSVMNSAWFRLMCCDSEGYEYEQPYFTSHVSEWAAQKGAETVGKP